MTRPDIPDKMFFRIGEASELVGVEAHVLRYWEGEFKLRPQRSASGQRMYRRKDLEKFLRIRQLVHEEGFTLAGARKALQGGAKGHRVSSIDPNRIEDAVASARASGIPFNEITAADFPLPRTAGLLAAAHDDRRRTASTCISSTRDPGS